MTVTQGPIRDRRGPRINTKTLFSKDCHMLQRSFHTDKEQRLQLCGCNWFFLGENEHLKECLRSRGLHQSLTSAHIPSQVFHLQIYSLSNKYPCGKTLLQNNNKVMKKINIHHKTRSTWLDLDLKSLDLAQVYQGGILLQFTLLICTSALGLLRLEFHSAHLHVQIDCMPRGQKDETLQRLEEEELQMLAELLMNLQP